MEVLHERCCGLDVHKKTVVACLITPGPEGAPQRRIQSFSTMTQDLLSLGDWLREAGCTHVAMESTGVFWKPIYNLLEDEFALLLVNAQHIKTVPGRKTDVRDCEWIAQLLRHGLLRASFIPDREDRELRELVRYRTTLVQERDDQVNRVQKTLEGGNIKLASVATDIMGKSAREMLAALIAGATEQAASKLAQLAKGRMRSKIPQLERALAGRMGQHQRFMLAQQLAHIDFLDAQLVKVSAEISQRLQAVQDYLELLDEITGIGRTMAEVVVAEIGLDMSRFPSEAHLSSWACLCPGSKESAGKRYSGRTRRGNRWLRPALVEAAHAAGRSQRTYLSSLYHALVARLGKKKGALAIAHRLLTLIYHVLKDATPYHDPGPQHLTERTREASLRRHLKGIARLGFEVSIKPIAA